MEVREGKNYALKSRAIGVLGLAVASRKPAKLVRKAPKPSQAANFGTVPTSPQSRHIAKSVRHMDRLRHKA